MSTVVSPTPERGFPLADLKAGFLVFLIALPLCLGIAMASGFPPVAGVLTAIIGGVVVRFLGSARLTIKGPAAGLIVIALGAVQELGGGDAAVGYRRALAVGVVAAVFQIGLALLRAATVGIAMSPSVVHGMLAAIGVIIISKQAHTMLGVAPVAHEPLGLLAEIPHSMANANPEIFALGALSLLVLFGLPRLPWTWAKRAPAPVVVLGLTVALGLWFDLHHPHDYRLLSHAYHAGPEFLVQLPGSLLAAVTYPDFSQVLSGTSLKYVVMYTLIGTIESTLSVIAVDSMDPEKRASDLNRDLLGLGVGNLAASMIGGLPMISEIVRSKANVDAGARSGWANFFHGGLLLLFVAMAPGLLQEIPLAALGAMLVYTGARLASPGEFAHAKQLGWDQFALFFTTFAVTLATDLLVGVATGMVLKVGLHLYRGVPLSALLRPAPGIERHGQQLVIKVDGAAIFTVLLPLRQALQQTHGDLSEVIIDVQGATLVDHTFLARLEAMAEEWPDATLTIRGLDDMATMADHPLSSRMRRPS